MDMPNMEQSVKEQPKQHDHHQLDPVLAGLWNMRNPLFSFEGG